MALGEVAAVLARVVSAVGAAHALGIVHRDLKPDNVFLAETGDGVDVKVLDFGIAKLTALDGDAAQTGGLTNTGAMLGTPYYMSPEQAFGERNIDHRADIWSLGIILYRAITGLLPTRADNIGQILKVIMMGEIKPIETIAPELPADLVTLIGRMLSTRREDRPSSLLDVKLVLERYAGVEVAGFGAPATAAPSPSTLAVTASPAASSAATPPSAHPAEQSMGGVAAGSARAGAAPRSSSLPWILGGGLVIAAVGGLALFAQSRAASSNAQPTSTVAQDSTAATPAAAPPSAAEVPAASSRPSEPPEPVPSQAVAAASASSNAPAVPSSPSLAPSARAGAPWPKAKPAEGPAAPAAGAPKPETTSVGGVITAPPQF